MAAKTYVARCGFMLGHPMDQALRPGDTLEVDGSTIKHQGTSISMPAIRGAIQEKWLVLADSPEGKALLESDNMNAEAGFSHMSTRKNAAKPVAQEDGIDVASKGRRGKSSVETDADRTVGELKTPTQRPEFIVRS